MACTHPLDAYKSPGGAIVFDSRRGYADLPLKLNCGRCIGCKIDRARAWTVRLLHEGQMHEKKCFITLTYDNENLPNNLSLNVQDWQHFAKRVRKNLGPLRYYHVGEYGSPDHTKACPANCTSQHQRPHFHACIFGQDFQHKFTPQQQHSSKSKLLQNLWKMGFTTIGAFNEQTAAYCARYITTKITGEQANEHYERLNKDTGEIWQVKPEYSTMSLKPGIGKTWYQKYHTDIYPSDDLVINNKHYKTPQYYDELLKQQNPELYHQIIRNRKEYVHKHKENRTTERLATMETINKKKIERWTKHTL